MSRLVVFQNGVYTRSREPIFQIGEEGEDGRITPVVKPLMTREEAEAKLAEMQPAPEETPAKKEAPAKKTLTKKKASPKKSK